MKVPRRECENVSGRRNKQKPFLDLWKSENNPQTDLGNFTNTFRSSDKAFDVPDLCTSKWWLNKQKSVFFENLQSGEIA